MESLDCYSLSNEGFASLRSTSFHSSRINRPIGMKTNKAYGSDGGDSRSILNYATAN